MGVCDGDTTETRSRRGRALLDVVVDDAVRPGVCFAPVHWADAFGPDVAVNAVTNGAVDADSLQPEFTVCAVAVTAIETEASPTQLTPKAAAAPIEALAAALGPLPSLATLSEADLLGFSVLGFDDSSYADFRSFARKRDARLEHLGAHRIVDRVCCEPDFESTAQAWTDRVAAMLGEDSARPATPKHSVAPSYSRASPLRTTVASNVALCGADSDKDVRNVGIYLPEGTLEYGVGDALGVWPHNRPDAVAEFLDRTGLDGSVEVSVGDQAMPLVEALRARLDITRITPGLLRFVHQRHPADELQAVIEEPTQFAERTWRRQALDLLASHPVKAEVDERIGVLRPLTPRLNTISSSPLEDPTKVHVATSVVQFESSTAATDGGRGHNGANWLFFGERHQASEFYCRDELDAFARSGVRTRLDTASSGDSADKLYVQDRMQENAADLWTWSATVSTCTCAATLPAWRATSTRRSRVSSPSTVDGARSAPKPTCRRCQPRVVMCGMSIERRHP
ncbi:molybdopterin dinucleotide binding domain-containing protein [Candidatus Mycobacterium methanotrophicum]|uniref:Uncharacterized protein n=1 Tax=Candidatus Mycobacterium methanotrophicum TaxID=2943498 RepID=A0ABY4QQG1_9MYCO|nr:molybdopterin dinucleotide binding domain-containing protein [Candidatus Mycobacterium methanotrophicum]UQX12866.1 hypothetical protein M5I08_01590 [Candidatus Mycobacterium methanotrophicum]